MLTNVLNFIFPYEPQIDPAITETLKEKWEQEGDFAEMFMGKNHLVIYRNPQMGHLNGYVGIKRNHPFFGKEMSDSCIQNLRCHGGVTFTGCRIGFDRSFKKGYWYIGFDTAHHGDYVPKLFEDETLKTMMAQESIFQEITDLMRKLHGGEKVIQMPITKRNYKDIEFVADQVSGLFHQLVEAQGRYPFYRYSPVKEYRRLHRAMKALKPDERKMLRQESNSPSKMLKKGTYMRIEQMVEKNTKATFVWIDKEVTLGAVVKLFDTSLPTRLAYIPNDAEEHKKERFMAYQNPVSAMILERKRLKKQQKSS